MVTNELMSNRYKINRARLIDAYDRCLTFYRLINALGEQASGALERTGDEEEEGLEPSSSPQPSHSNFVSISLFVKWKIPFYGSGKKNPYKCICKAKKAVTLTSYSNISLNYFCPMTIVYKFNHKPP